MQDDESAKRPDVDTSPQYEKGKIPLVCAAATKVPPSPPENKKTTECRPDQTPLRKTIMEVVALALTFGLAVIYWGQLGQMIEGTKLAHNAATSAGLAAWNAALQTKISREQFTADQRPWIALDKRGIEPYGLNLVHPAANSTSANFGRSSAKFSFTAFLENYGHSPAVVSAAVRLMDMGYSSYNEKRTRSVERFCSSVPQSKRRLIGTIVPGSTVPVDFPPLLITYDRRTKSIKPTIEGCLWYQAANAADSGSTHHAQFSGDVYMRPDPNKVTLDAFPIPNPCDPTKPSCDPSKIMVAYPGMIGGAD